MDILCIGGPFSPDKYRLMMEAAITLLGAAEVRARSQVVTTRELLALNIGIGEISQIEVFSLSQETGVSAIHRYSLYMSRQGINLYSITIGSTGAEMTGETIEEALEGILDILNVKFLLSEAGT